MVVVDQWNHLVCSMQRWYAAQNAPTALDRAVMVAANVGGALMPGYAAYLRGQERGNLSGNKRRVHDISINVDGSNMAPRIGDDDQRPGWPYRKPNSKIVVIDPDHDVPVDKPAKKRVKALSPEDEYMLENL